MWTPQSRCSRSQLGASSAKPSAIQEHMHVPVPCPAPTCELHLHTSYGATFRPFDVLSDGAETAMDYINSSHCPADAQQRWHVEHARDES